MITKVFKSGNSMALRIPKELDPVEGSMTIERKGEGWVVCPLKSTSWPENFFDDIHIGDTEFVRPDQGDHRDIRL